MGVNREGLFVGLTNQRSAEAPPSDARSRGEIVLEALRCEGLDAALARLERFDPEAYAPFNLALGDGERLFVVYGRRQGWERVALDPGVHVLANDRLGSPWFPKTERMRRMVEALVDRPWDELREGLAHVLADNAVPEEVPVDPASPVPQEWARALQALCIHTEVYGTRSSTIAALSPGRVHAYLFAEGPPDRAPFRDITALLGDRDANGAQHVRSSGDA